MITWTPICCRMCGRPIADHKSIVLCEFVSAEPTRPVAAAPPQLRLVKS